RRVWRNSRRDGAGTTRGFHCASSTLWVIWTQSANSHTGRRLSSCRIKGRTDDSIRPRATTTPTFSLAWKGASTDGNQAAFDVGAEDPPVHRPVDDKGRGSRIDPQPRHQGGGLPVTMRHAADQPFSRIPPSCAREETPESRGMPCLFLNTERGFGGKP